MDDFITRNEHEEFRRSIELANQNLAGEDKRQNKRIDILEENVKQITALVTNVERLAVNMENMLKVQEQQGERLKNLEKREEITTLIANVERLTVNMEHVLKAQKQQAERVQLLEEREGAMWRKVIDHVVTAVVGAVTCFVFTQIGM